jgi:UDP-N-acetylmuramate--alanine ligase
MHEKGHHVAGSDRAFDADPTNPLLGVFRARGIEIFPQDGSGLDSSFDLMVISTAVEEDRPEVLKAKALGVPIATRPECLAGLVGEFDAIAVAGTSGKTTASGMLAFVMGELGLKPNFIGGGRVKNLRSPGNPGNFCAGESPLLVVEACESDGTIAGYRPGRSVILNLSLDHHGVEKTLEMFRELKANTRGPVFINADDENLGPLLSPGAVTFSIEGPSRYRAEDVTLNGLGSGFEVNGTGFELLIPGRHNVYDALSSIAVLSEMGVPLADTARCLSRFRGIERRFDIHLESGEYLVVDDYAHNPHKISALMKTMHSITRSVCYIFQPHGFAPTKMMKEEYTGAFAENLRDTDHLVLLPIFYSGGTASRDISSADLVPGIRARGRSVEAVEGRGALPVPPGRWHAWVVCGARDESLSTLARDIAKAIEGRKKARPGRSDRGWTST